PEVPGGQRAARRVLHVVGHRPHRVTARAAADFLHALEHVVVRDGHRADRHHDQRGERHELHVRRRRQGGDAEANGTRAREVFRLDEQDPHAQYDPENTEEHAERLDDEDQAGQIERQHRQAFVTPTAVTLYSGWRDMGSTASDTVRFTRKAASKNAAKSTPCRGPAVTTALPVISLKRLRTSTASPVLIPRVNASASLISKWPRPEAFAS